MLFLRYILKLLIALSEMLFEPPKRGLSNLVTWRLVGFIRADADRLVILQGAPEQVSRACLTTGESLLEFYAQHTPAQRARSLCFRFRRDEGDGRD